MKIRSTALETVIGITGAIPGNEKPEIAFAGRSNVGKSSLINALMQRKSFARVSQKPGKTQTINFYHINAGVSREEEEEKGFAPDLYLVDLPGYGYANVPESEKKKWGPMIERYLHGSKVLRTVFLLVDIRHLPTKDDIRMHEWILANGYRPVIIATKKDKVKKAEAEKNIRGIRKALHMPAETPLIAFSAVTKEGLDEIWQYMKETVWAS